MKKLFAAAAAALLAVSASAFADGLSFNGFVRAGLSSTLESDPVVDTTTWLPGIYFNGDSSSSRFRLNAAYDGKNDNGSYGAFVRVQYSGDFNDIASYAASKWIPFAYARMGLLNDVVTVAAGKMQDKWIGSDGFEGWSVIDKGGSGCTGAVVAVAPAKGLTFAGGAVTDFSDNKKLNEKIFLGGVKYASDAFTADASYAGYGLLTLNVNFTGVKGLLATAEGEVATTDDFTVTMDGVKAETDVQLEYTGVDKWTFGVLSFQKFNDASVSGDNDFTFTVTPAVAYSMNSFVRLAAEGTYTQSVYDKAPDPFVTIQPIVTFTVLPGSGINVWGNISTDTGRSKDTIGMSVIQNF